MRTVRTRVVSARDSPTGLSEIGRSSGGCRFRRSRARISANRANETRCSGRSNAALLKLALTRGKSPTLGAAEDGTSQLEEVPLPCLKVFS
jgi:hypothetical protein